MYCKIKQENFNWPDDLFPNRNYVKVLAILSFKNRANRIVLQANWPTCLNPSFGYDKNEIQYLDSSIENEKEQLIYNAYWMDYDNVELIQEYTNNRRATGILDSDY